MSLQARLDRIREGFEKQAPPEVLEIMHGATERLREYLVKGFTMDDERLKDAGGGRYWRELLERIRDIRSSEKVVYRQVLDLYATSVDYDPRRPESREFFQVELDFPFLKPNSPYHQPL